MRHYLNTRRMNGQTCVHDMPMIQCNQIDTIHKNRCPLLHRYTYSLFKTSRVILRYFWSRYISYNRVLILVNIETTYSLTAWRPLQWRNAASSMSHCRSRSDLALLRGEVFAVFRHVFAVSGPVVVAVLPLLAGYIILVIITVITGTSAVYRLCHS